MITNEFNRMDRMIDLFVMASLRAPCVFSFAFFVSEEAVDTKNTERRHKVHREESDKVFIVS